MLNVRVNRALLMNCGPTKRICLQQFWPMARQPCADVGEEFPCDSDQLLCICWGRGASHVVFNGVAFDPAHVEIVCVGFFRFAQDQGKRLNRPEVGQGFFRPVPLGEKQDGAELQGGIVGDAKAPILGQLR